MKNKYKNWITENYPTVDSAFLQCKEACEKMQKEFPELEVIKGLAHIEEPYGLLPTKTPHCWLKDGYIIIDPTAHQYSTQILKYEEERKDLTIIGKCKECGGLGYAEFESFCSIECRDQFTKDLFGEVL